MVRSYVYINWPQHFLVWQQKNQLMEDPLGSLLGVTVHPKLLKILPHVVNLFKELPLQ